jgi:protein-S-isoprenylcysteine O-methyltransferase Ste14
MTTTGIPQPRSRPRARRAAGTTTLRQLLGSGDRIVALLAPFLVVGVTLNVLYPGAFSVGGPPTALRVLSIGVLVPGVATWFWSAALILVRVPQGRLITTGPYAIVKHPIYTSVALLVLPWAGFLLDSWLGVLLGAVLYVASRRYAPREEADLAATFGLAWDDYCRRVRLPWL